MFRGFSISVKDLILQVNHQPTPLQKTPSKTPQKLKQSTKGNCIFLKSIQALLGSSRCHKGNSF